MNASDLAFDRDHLWHPYTSLTDPLPVYPVVGASGCKLRLANGRELVDGMSSWWCAIHGYNVPELNEAIRKQTESMTHVMFGGITHPPAVALGRKLVNILPKGLDRIFLADSGSVSVEVAMKMAVQYQHARGFGARSKFLTLRGGYHGDTTAPMSVCDPQTGMHHLFTGFLPEHHFYKRPPGGYDADVDDDYRSGLADFFARYAHSAAAFVVEPVVQGAGGMHFYSPAYLRVFRELCDHHGLLLIFDEIATGFGRTGRLFVGEDAGERASNDGKRVWSPDIMTVGKALTGGTMTLAATVCTTEVAETIGRGEAGVMMHGPTFMGNPLACAVACASIDLLLASPWEERVKFIESRLTDFLRPAAQSFHVKEVRVLGAIGVVELHEPVNVAAAQANFVAAGAWIRPFGRLIYLMPPFTITEAELELLCDAVVKYV